MADGDSRKALLYHKRLANSFQLSVSVLVPLMAVICGFLARQRVFDHNFYLGDVVYVSLSAAYVITSALFFYLRSRQKLTKPAILALIAAYNVITLLYTLLLTGFVSVFLVAWVPLMVSTDLYFGRKGFVFSFLSLAVAGALTAIMYPNLSDPLYLIVLSQEVLGLGVLAYVIVTVRRIAEKEGRLLIRVSAEEELQRERLLSLINSMRDGVVSVGSKGNVTVYNAAFLSLIDMNVALGGKRIDDILRLHDRDGRPVGIVEEVARVGQPFTRTDLLHTFPNGEQMRLLLSAAPIKPGYQVHGERGFLLVLRDITKEKTLEDEQDAFISVVSHELRTPIAVTEGDLDNAKLLREKGENDEKVGQIIEDAHQHVLDLAKIINDLDMLGRLEKETDVAMEDVPLNELIAELHRRYQPKMKAKGLRFELALPEGLPPVRTNREYAMDIIDNLLSNALKYTAKGTVTLVAETKDGVPVVTVKDTGSGIGKSDQPHVFEKFYRSEDFRTRESGGTGLGLYISLRLAQKLGCALTFESQQNKGSAFSLAFPKATGR